MPLDVLLREPSEHAPRCLALHNYPFQTTFEDNGFASFITKPPFPNRGFQPKTEGPTLEPNSFKLGICLGWNPFTLVHQSSFWHHCFWTCVASTCRIVSAPNLHSRVTSHTSQEPWPWHCKSPKESAQRPPQHTSKIMKCDHRSSSVMWSHMWLDPQLNPISMNFYSCGSSRMIK